MANERRKYVQKAIEVEMEQHAYFPTAQQLAVAACVACDEWSAPHNRLARTIAENLATEQRTRQSDRAAAQPPQEPRPQAPQAVPSLPLEQQPRETVWEQVLAADHRERLRQEFQQLHEEAHSASPKPPLPW